MELSHWFHVRFDEHRVYRNVSPPGKPAWSDQFAWSDVVRVCFEAGDFLESDSLYIFTRQRPESYVIPMEAEGGQALLDEIIRRKLFPAELAIRAATATEGLFCWPEGEPAPLRQAQGAA
jgi:hypothetical protein